MGVLTKIQLVLKHLQFVGLLRNINIPFPRIYINFASLSNLISLDPTFLQSIDADFPVLTFRLQFFLIAVALPLMIMMLTLLVFVNFSTIMWMGYSLMSVLLVIIRISQLVNSSFVNGGNVSSVGFLLTMIFSVLYCVAYRVVPFVIRRRIKKQQMLSSRPEDRYQLYGNEEEEEERLKREDPGIMIHILESSLTGVMFIAGGCMASLNRESLCGLITAAIANWMCYIYKASIPKKFKVLSILLLLGIDILMWIKFTLDMSGEFPEVLAIPAYAIIVLASVGWLHFMFTSTSSSSSGADGGGGKGSAVGEVYQRARVAMQNAMDRTLLQVAFFFLSSAFVPVVTSCFQQFVCEPFDCPVGTKFNPYLPVDYSRPSNVTLRNQYCDPCSFIGDCYVNASAMCPQFNESRLYFHPDTQCNDSLAWYYKAAACVVLAVFVCIVSVMYFQIIGKITHKLRSFTQETYQKLMEKYMRVESEFKKKQKQNQTYVAPPIVPGVAGQAQPAQEQQATSAMEQGALAALVAADAINNDEQSPEGSPLLDPTIKSSPSSPVASSVKASRARREMVLDVELSDNLLSQDTDAAATAASGADQNNKGGSQAVVMRPQAPSINDAISQVNTRINPKAQSLYNAYREGFQNFLFAENLHRLLLVIISVFVSPWYNLAAGLNLGIHLVFLVVLLAAKPYVGKVEQALASASCVCIVLSSLYATLLWLVPSSDFLTSQGLGVIALLIGALPIAFGAIGQVIELRRAVDLNKQSETKKRRRAELIDEKIEELRSKITASTTSAQEGGTPMMMTPEEVERTRENITQLQKKRDERTPEEVAQEELTDELNKSTKKSILQFFALGSIPVLLIALGLCVYATLNEPAAEFLNGGDLVQRTPKLVLGGRDSWQEFTDECCCFQSKIPIGGYNITERWACGSYEEGTTKSLASFTADVTVSRNRQRNSGANGLPLRNLCSRNFTLPNSTVSVSNIVTFTVPDAERQAANVSLFAYYFLW